MHDLPAVPGPLARDLRAVRAANPGPFTLEGTRTYVVGRRRPAVVDPGPDLDAHVETLLALLEDADAVTLLVTHGHADHAGAVERLASRLGGRGLAVRSAGAGGPSLDLLGDGDAVETDAGRIVALHTPGHTPEHLSFHWVERDALFPGDLLLGEGDTTWVAGYPGCVADYLSSLERLRALEPAFVLPAHGPPLDDPGAAIDRFEAHRLRRVEQVRRALAESPRADAGELVRRIYGDEVPPGLRPAALESVRALLEHVMGPRAG